MIRATMACILATLLFGGAVSAPAADLTVVEQAGRLKAGRKIKVELNSGEILKGRMGAATNNQFTLEPRDSAQGTSRVVRFSEAKSVKADGLTTGEKWAIFGLIWVAVGIVGKLKT